MANLETKYLGLQLKNPVIIGACNLSYNLDMINRLETSGASAIVFKSLFEEQIQLENLELYEELTEYVERNAEMLTLFPDIKHAGPVEYLMKLKKLKESVHIPVIASLNAVYKETWLEYSRLIEETGVDAIELNFYDLPGKFDKEAEEIIEKEINLIAEIKKQLKIPVSIKLSHFYANPLNVITSLDKAGADGIVLFNKLFQPDIDIHKEEYKMHFMLSDQSESRLPMRFAGLLYGNIHGSICCNTGIHTGDDVIKMILAGADCVQVVSTIYRNKPEYIKTILSDIEKWMESKKYNTLTDFRGKLSRKMVKDGFVFKRGQYIDIIMNNVEVFKKYPLR